LPILKTLGQAIALSQEKSIASAEESVGRLALAVASKIVKREIEIDETVVQNIVRESLEAVKGVKTIKLRVNARDMDRIRDHKDVLLRAADGISDFGNHRRSQSRAGRMHRRDRLRCSGCKDRITIARDREGFLWRYTRLMK